MPIIYDPPGFGGDQTLAQLVDEVLTNLQQSSVANDQVTALSADITDSSLTFKVDDPNMLGTGIVEVGDELVWVQSIDTTTSEAKVLPRGRGWRSTNKSGHEAGETVTVAPAFPRAIIARELNNQILGVYPSLFSVLQEEFDIDSYTRWGWAIPAEMEMVLDVRWRDYQSNWNRVSTWEVENSVSAADFPSGKCLNISGVPVGRTVQVLGGVRPHLLELGASTFASTGLPAEAKDLVVWGSLVRLLPSTDIAGLTNNRAASAQPGQQQPGLGTQISKEYQSRYAARLNELRTRLQQKYPARVHTTR